MDPFTAVFASLNKCHGLKCSPLPPIRFTKYIYVRYFYEVRNVGDWLDNTFRLLNEIK